MVGWVQGWLVFVLACLVVDCLDVWLACWLDSQCFTHEAPPLLELEGYHLQLEPPLVAVFHGFTSV